MVIGTGIYNISQERKQIMQVSSVCHLTENSFYCYNVINSLIYISLRWVNMKMRITTQP